MILSLKDYVMKILLLYDIVQKNDLSEDFIKKLSEWSRNHNINFNILNIKKDDLHYCFGCMKCWANNKAVCIHKDRMKEYETYLPECSLVIFLSSVIFGTFSFTIKTFIDKGFAHKIIGGKLYPKMMIGYGLDITDEEKDCFIDITKKHCGYADEVHPEYSKSPVYVSTTRSINENIKVINKIEHIINNGNIK